MEKALASFEKYWAEAYDIQLSFRLALACDKCDEVQKHIRAEFGNVSSQPVLVADASQLHLNFGSDLIHGHYSHGCGEPRY